MDAESAEGPNLVQLVHQKYSLIHLSKTIGESSWSHDCDVSMEEITGSTARRAQMREQELKASFSPFTRRLVLVPSGLSVGTQRWRASSDY